MDKLDVIAVVCSFLIGMMIGIFIICLVFPISMSQDTGDDICRQITNNSVAVAHTPNDKLICEIPSYDHTQNIIIKQNNE